MYYIFYGPESGARQERIREVQKGLSDVHGDGLAVNKYYLSEDSPERIISDLDNGTLFSSHTLALINNAELLSRVGDIKKFADALPVLAKSTTLIFISDSGRLNNGLLALGKQESFKELTEAQKGNWVGAYLGKWKLRIEVEALDVFLSLVAGDTHSMRQELDKLLLLFLASGHGDEDPEKRGPMTVDFIEQYIYHSREESVFTLFGAYTKRDFSGALEILEKLQGAGANEETGILIRMGYQIRQLATLSNVQRRHRLQSSDFRNAQVYGSRNIDQYRAALSSLDTAAIRRHVLLCGEFEMMLRRHKSAFHHHIIQLWLYALFFPSWKVRAQGTRPFGVDHQRFS